jgi:hypothetical protein
MKLQLVGKKGIVIHHKHPQEMNPPKTKHIQTFTNENPGLKPRRFGVIIMDFLALLKNPMLATKLYEVQAY